MNDKTAGNGSLRRTGALALAAVVVLLATACSVQRDTSYPIGPAGSASYRQEIAFVQCMRSHGAPGLPDPPPGGAITVQVPKNGAGKKLDAPSAQAVNACKHLLPRGHRVTNVRIVIG